MQFGHKRALLSQKKHTQKRHNCPMSSNDIYLVLVLYNAIYYYCLFKIGYDRTLRSGSTEHPTEFDKNLIILVGPMDVCLSFVESY